MSRTKLTLLIVVAALALYCVRNARADDPPAKRPPSTGERWEDDKTPPGGPAGHGPRRPDERRPDAERDGDRPPSPPRDGDADRPRQRDGDADRPRSRDREDGPERRRFSGPREGFGPRQGFEGRAGFGEGRPSMPGGYEGRQGPEGRRPSGPPRWPHEDWATMEKNDPEMYKLLHEDGDLERRTRELALQIRQAPTDKRDELKKQLTEQVTKQFEVRQQRRGIELKRLEGELQRLREAIERRNKVRDQLIERRVADLMGTDADLGF
jgi:hypothetical protein